MSDKYEWKRTRSQGANGGLPSLVLYKNDQYTAQFVIQDKHNNKVKYSSTEISGYNTSGDMAYFGTNSILFDNTEKLNCFLKENKILSLNEDEKTYVETVDSYSVHLYNFSNFTIDIQLIALEQLKKESESEYEFFKKVHRNVTLHDDIRIVEPSRTELKEFYTKS